MISINCGLFLPDNLKPFMKNPAVCPAVSLHWELGFINHGKPEEKIADEKPNGFWENLGLKKFIGNKNMVLNVTIKFVLEFAGDDPLPGVNSKNLLEGKRISEPELKWTSESKISEPEENEETSKKKSLMRNRNFRTNQNPN
jgi:hypothetical protein